MLVHQQLHRLAVIVRGVIQLTSEQGSQFGYPKRLQKAQFNLQDIDNVIIAGEVEESYMKNMLKKDWGMGRGACFDQPDPSVPTKRSHVVPTFSTTDLCKKTAP